MTKTNSSAMSRALRSGITVATAAALAGCTLDAVNPGPIQADALNNVGALAALVNGAGRDLSEALNWVGYTSAAVAREIQPAGSTGSFGITVLQQAGKLTDSDDNTFWNLSQRARWTAEDAVVRGKAVLGTAAANNVTLAQAMIWAGHANRLLGENFCEGVINGGAPGPSTVYLERAEGYFTEAITVATAANNTNLKNAATAGRASVRLLRNNPTGAAADAATVADAQSFKISYYAITQDQYNRIYWASANSPYRAHTTWNTVNEAYRKATPDPRVAFDSSASQLTGDAAVPLPGGGTGRVRWYFQTKYPDRTSPIALSSGWEMRLIEAEAKLIAGTDIAGAMTLINKHRVALGLAPWTATTLPEAWTALKRERGIELWLEGRRLGDLRRWAALTRPGALDPLEELPGRDLCFNTPLSEKQTNTHYGT